MFNPSATTTYTLTSNQNSGGQCVNTATFTVTANPLPVVVANAPSAVCNGSTVDLTATAVTTGSTSGLSYSYFTDASATTVLVNPNAVASSGTYYIKGTNANGCSVITPVTVTISAATSTISILLPASATTATYNAAVTITATVSQAGTVNFKLDGTTITGCGSVATSGTSTITATCSWTPNTTGALALTAVLTPTSSNYSSSTSSTLTVKLEFTRGLTITVSK